jgi:hypothetical protein
VDVTRADRRGAGRPGPAAELRAVVDRYAGRLNRSVAPPPRTPDAAVTEHLSTPFTGVDDVYDRLSAAETHLRGSGDRRAVFLTVYVAMTDRVRAGVGGVGGSEGGEESERDTPRFERPDWVRAYLVAFAEEYRRALVDFERGRRVPPAWRVAFGAALGGETLVLQDALLGINAHIVNDLAFALDAVGIGEGETRARRRADHLAINEVLAGLADAVQTALVEVYEASGLADADALLGRLDERATVAGLRAAREFAWANAVLLADHPRLGPFVRWRVRTVAAGTAYALLSPTVDPALRGRFREAEAGEAMLATVSGAVRGVGRAGDGESGIGR